jgi:hypothetical protein
MQGTNSSTGPLQFGGTEIRQRCMRTSAGAGVGAQQRPWPAILSSVQASVHPCAVQLADVPASLPSGARACTSVDLTEDNVSVFGSPDDSAPQSLQGITALALNLCHADPGTASLPASTALDPNSVPWLGHQVSQLTRLQALSVDHLDHGYAAPRAQYCRPVLDACTALSQLTALHVHRADLRSRFADTVKWLPRRALTLRVLELGSCLLPASGLSTMTQSNLTRLVLAHCRISAKVMLALLSRVTVQPGCMAVLDFTGNEACPTTVVRELLAVLRSTKLRQLFIPTPGAGKEGHTAIAALITTFAERHGGKYDVRAAGGVALPPIPEC